MIKPADSSLFFSKNDPLDPRLGDFAKLKPSLELGTFGIVGHPDDEGIKLNGGRLGAALGPTSIRKALYKMTPKVSAQKLKLADLGDVIGHEESFELIKKSLAQSARILCLGGGHDYGYPDFAAFIEDSLNRDRKPVVINFDAHLDVRPSDKGNNSGTPFYRLLQKYAKDILFFEVGLQDWCNSEAHFEWAKAHGAQVIMFDEIMASGQNISSFLSERIFAEIPKNSDISLSLDIDFFSSAYAPGASQVFPVGIDAPQFLSFWKAVCSTFKPRLMGVYEVSPPLDLDERTARLAAIFCHQFIFS
jgi:formiminoglutamase